MIETIFRTLFFYFIIVIAYRIMGKREVGQLGIIDLIVSILIAELVALGIEKTNISISYLFFIYRDYSFKYISFFIIFK